MRPYARYPTRKGGDFFIRVGPAHMHLTKKIWVGPAHMLLSPGTTWSYVNHFLIENKLFFS